ncbi:hypothetical protein ASD00_30730 [Ensifer sp. Root31]|nr:hypothetical protein ASD00_30730 [Ensifer sp. Root31]
MKPGSDRQLADRPRRYIGPISRLLVVAAQTLQFVIDEERHNLRQANGFALGIGEVGDALSLDGPPVLIWLRGLIALRHVRPSRIQDLSEVVCAKRPIAMRK